MRFLVDEMHSPTVAEALVEQRHDAVSVAADPALKGLSDAEVFRRAGLDERVLVTEDSDHLVLAAASVAEQTVFTGLLMTSTRRHRRSDLAYPGSLMSDLVAFADDPPVAGVGWVWWL